MSVIFIDLIGNYMDSVTSFTPPSQGTLCFWMQPWVTIGSQRIIGADTLWEVRLSGTTLLHELYQSSQPSYAGVSMLQWHHWAFTYDGTNKGIYRDGVEEVYGAYAHGTPTSGMLSMGTSHWRTTEGFNGQLDDVRIYDRALGQAEIETIATTEGSDGIFYGMIHRWEFNEVAEGAAPNVARDWIGGLHMEPVKGSNITYGWKRSTIRR